MLSGNAGPDAVHVSLSEIETTVTKAALGAGLALGLAEEAGAAARHGALAGLDPLAAFLPALESLDSGRAAGFAPDAALAGDFRPTAASLSALAAGPSALDLLAAGEGEVRLFALDAPGVVVALALRASKPGPSVIRLRRDGRAEALCRGGALQLAGALDDLVSPGPCDLILDVPEACPEPPAAAKAAELREGAELEGAELDGALWRRLAALAARRLVAGTEASRLAGAGAGLVDRD